MIKYVVMLSLLMFGGLVSADSSEVDPFKIEKWNGQTFEVDHFLVRVPKSNEKEEMLHVEDVIERRSFFGIRLKGLESNIEIEKFDDPVYEFYEEDHPGIVTYKLSIDKKNVLDYYVSAGVIYTSQSDALHVVKYDRYGDEADFEIWKFFYHLKEIDRPSRLLGAGGLLMKIHKDLTNFCTLIDSNRDGYEGDYDKDIEVCFEMKR